MNSQIEKVIFGGRLLLLPMYLGLLLALVVYDIHFAVLTAEMVWHSFTLSETQILVMMLNLLDIIMVSHLIVMVMIGGFILFISGSYDDDNSAPAYLPKLKWLDHVDPGTLKVKMSMAILGISSIHLLSAFVNADGIDSAHLTKLVIVHLVFVISAMAVAWINRATFKH
jgi:uncharacterized protein (TIGR00645 family)